MSQPQQKVVNNLLSNINPPSELPSFVTASISQQTATPQNTSPPSITETVSSIPSESLSSQTKPDANFLPTQFSAAIPPQQQTGTPENENISSPTGTSSFHELYPINPNAMSSALEPITQGGANLFGWVKDAVSSGGLLQRVAEKTKNSLDTIVTTLDPQMREYIYSGGDIEVLVASDNDDKVRPIREAFQTVFGRATITGFPAQPKTVAAQPVGYENASIGAYERIENVREYAGPGGNLPIVAIENFIVEIYPDEWFDLGLIVLSDLQNEIELKTFTQMTPIPSSVITTIKSDTPDDYEFLSKGFSITVGRIMSYSLKVNHTEWHSKYTSVNRGDMILNAAKVIANLYKQKIENKLD